jgi:precorrin-6A/cobalt-precorrin-6A reductase
MKRLLVLGGTGDAVKLASLAILLQRGFSSLRDAPRTRGFANANDLPGLTVITSLAGRTSAPKSLVGEVRIGGFGGEAGLVRYLQTEQIDLLIDATHPFAAQISRNAAGAATKAGVPRLMLIRPGWACSPEDNWIEVESVEAAVAAIPASAERIFVTIGRQQLTPFASLVDKWCLMRSIDPPDLTIPLPPGKLLLDRGPFNLEAERELLQEYQIQAIVSKNSGGEATYAKIIAGRELGLPVIMIQRPIVPAGEIVTDVAGAIEWLIDRGY